jgi:branched-chain amino acid transport system substrate-binding protein
LRFCAVSIALMGCGAHAQQQGVSDTEILIGDVMPLAGPPALGGIAHKGTLWADYVEAETGPKGAAFLERVKKTVTEDEFKRVNRFTLTGYASARTMFEAIRQCGKAVTWACAIDRLEGMKGYDTGVMAPVAFSKTSHFSVQKPIVMEAVYGTRSFKPVQ